MSKIDDWDVNATKKTKYAVKRASHINSTTKVRGSVPLMSPSPMIMKSTKIGLAVGGAKDTDNFIENIKQEYLPKLDAITYEGTYYQHYFETGLTGECKSLFCPSYTKAMKRDLYTDEKSYYLNVGLNSGIEESDFKRKKLNLVVVLDISGSMGGRFNKYYYDKKNRSHSESESKSKMQIANEAIVAMVNHLNPEDSLGVVLFDNNAYRVKTLRKVKYTKMDAIKEHILALKEQGGTNWSAGYKAGLKYFDTVEKEGYENRLIFITDAMPNRGELKKDGLFGLAKSASEKGIYTTFIGVGVDFNVNLVEYVSKTRGANYYSVHSSKEFKQRMDSEFDFMVTPLVYDLELKLESEGYKIDAVYGSPQAKLATGSVMYVNTLFPSANDGKRSKGGVILLRLKKVGHQEDITLNVKYKDTKGKTFHTMQKVNFSDIKDSEDNVYDNNGIAKAILLADYVTLMKNWIIDARAGCNDRVEYLKQPINMLKKRCMVYPPDRPIYHSVKTWERKSCKLKVSDGYKKILSLFQRVYGEEMKRLGDKSLNEEFKILKLLLDKKNLNENDKEKKDDWNF
ncbi:MAG: VWA domain-containing protein [Campylobacterota bacterium]|nr:VWA domain-containing protein [Campylobacterota bacterium]